MIAGRLPIFRHCAPVLSTAKIRVDFFSKNDKQYLENQV